MSIEINIKSKIIIKNIFILIFCASLTVQLYAQCYELVWQDEFDSTLIDLTKWRNQNGAWSGSNVQNCYDLAGNTSVSDGLLRIEARYEPGYDCFGTSVDFTSGFIQTKDPLNWTFGRFEARIKMPASKVTWPAFWMSPQNEVYGDWPRSGEIDIMEVRGHDMTKAHGNAIWGIDETNREHDPKTYTFQAGNGADNWHIYSVEWQLGRFDFYIDDNYYGTIDNFDGYNATSHPGPFDIDFYLRLNLAVGGDYLDAPWNNAYNDISQLPAVMEVDWVRVYQDLGNCPLLECELIENGNFSEGTTGWSGWNCNVNTVADACQLTNIQQGENSWNAALVQGDFTLEQGKQYEVSFDANSIQNNRTIRVKVGLSEVPYTNYKYEEISLNHDSQQFTIPFTMSQPTTAMGRLEFHVGTNTTGLVLDNVQLKSLSDDCDNNCEQVQNGNFAGQFSNDWSIQNCQVTNTNEGIDINVSYVAENFWDIAIKQGGKLFEQGKTYQVSFNAKADAPRDIYIKAGKSIEPWNIYHLETINLTTELESHTFTFIMNDATDGNALFEFFFGESNINLFLGKVSLVETGCTGLRKGIETITNFEVFPNPFGNNFNVSLNLTNSYDIGIIRLFDLNGHIILEEEKALSLTNQFQLNVQAIPSGIYVLRVDVGEYFLTHKTIKY